MPQDPQTVGSGVRLIRDRLADGRELLYFDDAGSALPATRRPDERQLDPRPATNTMRRDPLSGDWITVAAARQGRAFLPPAELDPLAPQSPDNPSEIPDRYDVAVFENRSPAFGPGLGDPERAPGGVGLDAPGWGREAEAVGRCEVVCFAPDRTGSLGTLGAARARTVIEALAHRTAELSALPGVEQVFPFENRGEQIGVTLHHPHGQIYAYPYITPHTQALLRQIEGFGPGLFDTVLREERRGDRVLIDGEHFTAYVPHATHWPYEVHVTAHRNVPDLAATSPAEREELSRLVPRLIRALDALFDEPLPYIAAWHQAPVRAGRDEVRLQLRFTSPRRSAKRLKFTAGSEAAMGAWVGDVVPEAAAAALREALARADAAWAEPPCAGSGHLPETCLPDGGGA
ncbi:galactose-1-phosphate uridylyltransferase [Galactobacter valiniphilus]|uniref:galactose-1-phosphate uridylyltransferase n=1 Tax=Galactobacter valiniphilus TaxID=2676122 RepID=UPI0037367F51